MEGRLDGEVERRHGNGGGCGSRAREQKLASAFMGEQEEERGWARRSWGRTGSSGRAGSSRGARPVAVVAERGVRGGAGSQRGQHARSSGGDGVAQRGSGAVAAVTRWRGQAARQQCSGSGAARAGVRARVAQREQRSQGERGREREKREKERKVRELTLNVLKIFNGSSKKFEYESC